MIDAGLLTFQPANGYKLVIYQNNAEFMKKTGQPAGSRGVIFRGGLYTYAGQKLDRRLAYEITQLVISSYINRPNPDWLWVKDGLAAYEEVKMVQDEGYQQNFFAMVQGQMRQNPIPIEQLTTTPPPEGVQISNSVWHCQAESMIAFMITQTGSSQFGQFLAGLQSNLTLDTAVSQGFSGKWNTLGGFYQAWLQRG